MYQVKTILTSTVLCLLSWGIFAQEKRTLDLNEAIKLGLSQSKQLQIDNIQQQIIQSKKQQTIDAKLPALGLNLSYVRISDNITPFRVAFPTGEVTLNPQILNQSYNSLTVKQLIWSGGKVQDGIKMQDYENQALLFDIEKNKTDVSYTITTLWYNLFTVNETQKLLKANIESLMSQKKDLENFEKQGVVLKNDVLKIELGITNLESSLIEVTNTQNLLNYNLCLLTGLDTQTKIELPETLLLTAAQLDSQESFAGKALSNRHELKALGIRQKQTDLARKITYSNYLPTLSAGGRVNYDMPNQRLFPNEAKITGTWDVGIFLNWNISELFTNKEKLRESAFSISKLNKVYEQAKEGIMMEVNADYNNYLQAKQKIVNAQKAIEQATENLRVERNKLASSSSTATEFLTANNQLIQAQINKTTAMANAELAYRKLLKSTNQNKFQ
jgi:outer membrane protein